jgi:hypothetical protein
MNDQAGVRYELRVKGILDRSWSAWFDGLQVTSDDHGQTNSSGRSSTRRPCTACSPRSATWAWS